MMIENVEFKFMKSEVKLLTVTPDAEKHMAYCARVSNPANQQNTKFAGLLKYCIEHQHWSIFEQATMTVEINTSRGIAAQILRHRSFTYQEFSQRYADTNLLSDSPVIPDLRKQDTKNRQNSIDISDKELEKEWKQRQSEIIDRSQKAYNWALDHGIAKEQARSVLPEGMTMSRMYMNGTLRSWIHYIQLRSGNGTQKEHAEIAKECGLIIGTIFPLITSIIK